MSSVRAAGDPKVLVEPPRTRYGHFSGKVLVALAACLILSALLDRLPQIDLLRTHFEDPSGLLVWNLQKLWVTIVLVASIFSSGVILTARLRNFSARGSVSSLLLVSIPLAGFSALNVVLSSVLLLVGLTRFWAITLLLIPTFVVFLDQGSHRLLRDTTSFVKQRLRTNLWLYLSLVVAGVLLAFDALTPPYRDMGDIFEHYIPYLHGVADSGTTSILNPWYHFDLSRGYGLSLTTALISDGLSVSLVSSIAFFVLLLVLAQLVLLATRSKLLTVAAVVVAVSVQITPTINDPVTQFSADPNRWAIQGALFVITTFWFASLAAALRAADPTATHSRNSFAILALTAVNLGLSTQIYAAVGVASLAVAGAILAFRRQNLWRTLLFGAIFIGAASLLQLTVTFARAGYWFHGLVAQLIPISDLSRFTRLHGDLPLVYWSTAPDTSDLGFPTLNYTQAVRDGLGLGVFERFFPDIPFPESPTLQLTLFEFLITLLLVLWASRRFLMTRPTKPPHAPSPKTLSGPPMKVFLKVFLILLTSLLITMGTLRLFLWQLGSIQGLC